MAYSGPALFDYLARASQSNDPAASSHWQQQHENFSFKQGVFEGLRGFGGCHEPYSGIRRAVHRVLQIPFRRQGMHFEGFPEIDNEARKIALQQGRAYDLDFIRQSITLALLQDQLSFIHNNGKSSVCIIGDGFASLASLFLATKTARQVVLINLTKTLLVDCWYLKLWMGEERFNKSVVLLDNESSIAQAREATVVAIQAENHSLLQSLDFNLVVNVVSMGEMDPFVVEDYFTDIRTVAGKQSVHFYCCNRIEKSLPDGTVVRFSDYPWNETDEILIDSLCPWHQKYYSGRFPFYHQYDGPIKHRLARMAGGG
jgi:putative sugar O-methyltransferase